MEYGIFLTMCENRWYGLGVQPLKVHLIVGKSTSNFWLIQCSLLILFILSLVS
jgi:hypothetical protein